MRINKCNPVITGSNRHSWQWKRNVTTVQRGVNTSRISKRGLYECKCGEQKTGVELNKVKL